MKKFYIVEEHTAYRGAWVEAEDKETALQNFDDGMYEDLFYDEDFIIDGITDVYVSHVKEM